ncbi:MAG: hypothetical protein M3033_03500 [Acidobacteriota bacterium]|nr:hypothetical protein [Acidobacteriota bacterium]
MNNKNFYDSVDPTEREGDNQAKNKVEKAVHDARRQIRIYGAVHSFLHHRFFSFSPHIRQMQARRAVSATRCTQSNNSRSARGCSV